MPWHNRPIPEGFPHPGARLRYKGTWPIWFTNIIANAERELTVGTIYTLRTIQVASSWAEVTLEETGEVPYALGFFDELDANGNPVPFMFGDVQTPLADYKGIGDGDADQ